MGYGFPALVGVNKLNKQLFLYESDGSAMMNLQELQTLKTIGSKAKIFLINNNGYASIRNTQRNFLKEDISELEVTLALIRLQFQNYLVP